MNNDKLLAQIKSEFYVNDNGESFCRVRAAARLADVDESSIRESLNSGAGLQPNALAEFLIQQGFEGAGLTNWIRRGIPDIALAYILEYFGYECQQRYRKEQAKKYCRVFRASGIRAWIHEFTGWTKQPEKAIQIYSLRLEALSKTLVKPDNSWTVIEHCGHILLSIERCGVKVDVFDTCDISIGKRWATYRDGKTWQRRKKGWAQYTFPDRRGTQDVNSYDYNELQYFVKWLNGIYKSQWFPQYLTTKYGIKVIGDYIQPELKLIYS